MNKDAKYESIKQAYILVAGIENCSGKKSGDVEIVPLLNTLEQRNCSVFGGRNTDYTVKAYSCEHKS